MAIIDLGNIRLNWRGAYDPKVTYVRDDAVSYKGSSFIALQQGVGVTPIARTHWDLLAAGTDQLSQEGDLLIHDGKTPIRLPRGKNAQILQMKDFCPSWQDQSLDPSRRVWKLAKVNGLGGWHTRVYLMADGTIKACGHGGNFSNGNPAGAHTYVPTRLIVENPEGRDPKGQDPGVRFVEVFSGSMQHYALTAEGEVWSWGNNDYGHLGHGDTVNRAIAKRIEFFVANQIHIVRVIPPRNNYHHQACVYFLTQEGQVYACGINSDGNLGNGTSANQKTPVRCGALVNIIDVSVSGFPHSVYAIQGDGSLWVWGCNNWGQLGLGDTAKRETPLQHPSLKNVKKAITTCGHNVEGKDPAGFGMVLQTDGTILTTGWNEEGQLGVGDTNARHHFTPLKVPAGEIFVDILCGDGRHGSGGAINQQKELTLWGYNHYGQLGNGNTERQVTPFKPKAPFQGHVSRANFGGGSSYEGCIVQAGNALWAAGYAGNGPIGIGVFNKVNSTFQRVLGQSGIIEDWGVFGRGTDHWGLGALYNDGRVDACGENSVYGETGTQTANIHNVAALTNVIFV